MVSGPKSEDAELAETLRRDDPEQFLTLVRMHLSFVLDLNTDECDGVSEKSGKFRPMKWSFTPFAKKSKPVNRPVTEGVTLTQEGISQVYQLIQWLSLEQNVIQEGIFRRSGKMTRQQELKVLLTSGCPLKLDEGQFSVHDCASVLKNFLAQLPEPLLTEAYYPAHCQIAELCAGNNEPVDEERLLKAIQLILLLLPLENLQLLKDLFGLLHLTSTYAHVNKMSADNLATLFTPHLLCPRKLSPEALHTNSQTMSKVVSFMIKQGPTLFHIPAQLATDIRAYWSSRDKRTLLPKKDLNESTCDGMAAKTVFTFVDREKTAEASASANPTEAALAQLYAHIQSLPESSKKRKLIKQFNKENGQGTPQLIMGSNRTGRARNRTAGPKPRQRSRSLGDSIKKHIHVFNKGSKEPKKLSDEFYSKEPFDSPHSSPVTKVKNVFQKSDGENILPSPSVMPSLKKSLVMDVDEAKSIRMRLSANAKRTPASVTSENIGTDREESSSTSSNDSNTAGDERLRNVLKRTTSSLSHRDKNVDSKEGGPTKSPRIEPCFPSSVPSTQSGERLATSPDVKHPPGGHDDTSQSETCRGLVQLQLVPVGTFRRVGAFRVRRAETRRYISSHITQRSRSISEQQTFDERGEFYRTGSR
ncbi:rho GTPase-activating protein 19 isoform X3 [Thrips palmi]|uniref:Rho GTPase-activating protein 19 isoform X3 n=1 Tax=Thrips palmi TaxID=161013 RepID=A0A6P8ZJA4_THRPL|nr:rho GTPase-activating protein 19 isoform X3 [Thrips palmi]